MKGYKSYPNPMIQLLVLPTLPLLAPIRIISIYLVIRLEALRHYIQKMALALYLTTLLVSADGLGSKERSVLKSLVRFYSLKENNTKDF